VGRDEGPTLAEVQRRFFELVTGPEGVAKELARRGLRSDALDAFIVSDARASAVERLDVYADMYFFRILDVLRADYPKLLATLGEDAFHDIATDYLVAHPSVHPSLRFVGASLPTFVATRAGGRPWLGELASLEWARVDVFDREDAPALAREAVARVAPDDFAAIRLAAVPAFALVPAAWTVEELWRDVEDGRASARTPVPAAEGHALVVWRRGVTVHHRAVDRLEGRALGLLAGGTTFGALCAALAGGLPSDEAAAAAAAQLLGGWLADELVVAALD
jgi:hypothetical protein